MAEPTGHEVLEALLESLKGFASSDLEVEEDWVDEDIGCQVSKCLRPAVFQCSGGYQYCAEHAGVHGIPHARHEFKLIIQARRDALEEARQILEARLTREVTDDKSTSA